jgi:hypothetical protein
LDVSVYEAEKDDGAPYYFNVEELLPGVNAINCLFFVAAEEPLFASVFVHGKPIQPVITFVGKPTLDEGHLKGAPLVWTRALFTNIKLGRKGFPRTNTLGCLASL